MGRKGKWLSSLKKALSPEPKEKKEKKLWEKEPAKHENAGPSDSVSTVAETLKVPPPAPPVHEAVKATELDNAESNSHESVVAAAPSAAETLAVSVQPTVQVVCVTKTSRYAGKSEEEVAAIKIQTAFRGFLARRALRALKGLVRLKLLMEGPVVKRQAANTLRCMQTLSRVQCQIRTRRIRMSEENQALQRQLLQKHAKELVNLQMGDVWDDSLQSKEQIEASLLSKHEATLRRERAMAYSFTHQQTWKNSSNKSTNPLFMDPSYPTWGWSWLERWMAREGRNLLEKDVNNDQSSTKSGGRSSIVGEISKSYARYQLNLDRESPTAAQKPNQAASVQSPSTPLKQSSPAVARKLKPASPKVSTQVPDDDAKSMVSVRSERPRRHSIGSGSVRDDESLASSQGLPSYMVPTESARAKSRLSPGGTEMNGTPDKASAASAKKRLSYPPTPSRGRRHSLPPKLDSSTNTEISVANGGAS